MSTALFISKKISKVKDGSFSGTATNLAILGVALGTAVLILSFSILGGFQRTIKEKIFSFDSHIQISGFDLNMSFDGPPISINTAIYKEGGNIPGVRNISSVAYQKGIVHANEQVFGVMVKGVGSDYDSLLFKQNMLRGNFLSTKSEDRKEVILSNKIATQMQLEINDPLFLYFYIDGKLKPKKVFLSGVYETGMEEFDDRVVISNISIIQRLNHWPDTLVGGYEVFLDRIEDLDVVADKIEYNMDYDLQLVKVTDKFNYIFDWLDVLLEDNVNVLIGAIIIIVFFNIISTMYILLMERTPMIGILKALGSSDKLIKQVFLSLGNKILLKGLLYGNLIGLGICLMQDQLHLIPLDQETYYMSYVPIKWDIIQLVTINVVTSVFVLLILMLPLRFIGRVSLIKAIKFD